MNGKLIPVFVLAALMSCSQPPVKEQGPRPVKLAEVTSLNLVEKSFSGVVSPDQFSDLAFKMSGPLISLNVDEGQKVRTGQVVAEIDPQDFKWEYEAKKASFQTAEAQLQRAKKLLSKQAISKQEYETTEASYSNAKAAFEYEQNQLEQSIETACSVRWIYPEEICRELSEGTGRAGDRLPDQPEQVADPVYDA